MSKEQSQVLSFAIEKEKSGIDLKSILKRCSYYWLWFLGSAIGFLILAFIYLKVADPVYQLRATLLINQENAQFQQQSVLNRIDLPNSEEIVENEIAKLNSSKLIGEVLDELQLTTTYEIKRGLFTQDLYNSLPPFKLVLIKPTGDFDDAKKKVIKITVKDKKSYITENEAGDKQTYPFNTRMQSIFGTWELEPTAAVTAFKDSTIKVSVYDPEKLIVAYQKKLEVKLEDKLSSAVDLTYNDKIKQRGKDILNHLIQAYNNGEIQHKNEETQNTVNFIDQRLASLTGELSSSEKNIENFKSSNKLVDIASNSKFQLDNLQGNSTRLNDMNVRLSIITGIEKFMNDPKNKGKSPAVVDVGDPTLISSIERLSQLQLTRDQLLATTPETNPDFEPLNLQIQTTTNEIKEEVNNIKSSLLSARKQLQSLTSGNESSIVDLPLQEREFITIKRQQAVKESLYNYLLQKREEVSLSYASSNASNYRIIDVANVGPVKWPITFVIYPLALILGLIFPALIIFWKDRNFVKDARDIEEEVAAPILAEVSFNKTKAAIVTSEDSDTFLSEQFRELRTKLHHLKNDGEKASVILITSSTVAEGKSFISINLAVSIANTGKKTAILDFDLRKSKIAEIFNLDIHKKGITDYLQGKAVVGEIIQPSGVNLLLDIITIGSVVKRSSDLLENESLQKLITDLKSRYDEIIIDSPPLHLIADALVLSRVSDATLFIVRQGYTPKAELKFIKDIYKERKVHNMHIVFNAIDNKKFGYGYLYDNSYFSKAKR